MSGSLGLASSGLILPVTTENAKIARHLYERLPDPIRSSQKSVTIRKTNLRKNRVYTVFLDQSGVISDLA